MGKWPDMNWTDRWGHSIHMLQVSFVPLYCVCVCSVCTCTHVEKTAVANTSQMLFTFFLKQGLLVAWKLSNR